MASSTLPTDGDVRFWHETFVHMADTDAAGVLYFVRQFDLAHRAYEALFATAGLPLGAIIAEGSFALPLVHCEGDYRRPLRLGDPLRIAVIVDTLSERSFVLRFVVHRGEEVVGVVRATHVCIDTSTMRATTLDPRVRALLAPN